MAKKLCIEIHYEYLGSRGKNWFQLGILSDEGSCASRDESHTLSLNIFTYILQLKHLLV